MKSLREVVDSDWFRRAVIAAIFLNAVHIGLETDPDMVRRCGALLRGMDTAVLGLFSLEMLLRLLASAPTTAFFRDPWNWFDSAVIGAGFLPGAQFLTVFRLLRILRLMRTVRVLPGLKKIANAVFSSIPALANVLVILLLLFYIYGTAGTLLYGPLLPEKFGSLGRTLLTLFEIITLEGWAAPMHLLLPQAPFAWVYFISFILLGTYFALASVMSVLVGSLRAAEEVDEMGWLRSSLARIEARLERRGDR